MLRLDMNVVALSDKFGTGATFTGGDKNDAVRGTDGNDTIKTAGGNDRVYSGAGNDFVDAGAGNDYVDAGSGDDVVYGGSGNDTVIGGTGSDKIFGEDGNDWLDGGADDDFIDGGIGNDWIFGGTGVCRASCRSNSSGVANSRGVVCWACRVSDCCCSCCASRESSLVWCFIMPPQAVCPKRTVKALRARCSLPRTASEVCSVSAPTCS